MFSQQTLRDTAGHGFEGHYNLFKWEYSIVFKLLKQKLSNQARFSKSGPNFKIITKKLGNKFILLAFIKLIFFEHLI